MRVLLLRLPRRCAAPSLLSSARAATTAVRAVHTRQMCCAAHTDGSSSTASLSVFYLHCAIRLVYSDSLADVREFASHISCYLLLCCAHCTVLHCTLHCVCARTVHYTACVCPHCALHFMCARTVHYTACVPALCTTLHVLCVRRIRFNLDGDMLLLLEEVEGRQSERGRRAAEREEKRRFDCELEVAALAKAVGPPYTYDPEVSFPPPLFPSLSTEI